MSVQHNPKKTLFHLLSYPCSYIVNVNLCVLCHDSCLLLNEAGEVCFDNQVKGSGLAKT